MGQIVTMVVVLVVVGVVVTIANIDRNRTGRSGAATPLPPTCVELSQEPVELSWRVLGDQWPNASFEVPPESFTFRPDLTNGLDSTEQRHYLGRADCVNLYTATCTEAPLGGGSVGFLSYTGTARTKGLSAAVDEIATHIANGGPVPTPTYSTRKSWGDLVVSSASVEFDTPTPQRACRAPRVRITIAAMDLWEGRGTAYLIFTSLQGIDNAMTPELEEQIMLTMRPR